MSTVDELPDYARALLDAAKDTDDPTALERARGDAAVRTALAERGVRELPVLDAPLRSGLGSGAAAGRGALAWKIGIAATALLGAAFVARLTWPTPADPRASLDEASRAPSLPPDVPAPPAPVPVAPPQPPRVEPAPVPKKTTARHATTRGDDAVLARELRILASVNQLVREREYTRALRLLERTEPAAAPHALREERAALRVLTLCGDAPNAHALRERERFLASSPRSVLAARVRGACAAPEGAPR